MKTQKDVDRIIADNLNTLVDLLNRAEEAAGNLADTAPYIPARQAADFRGLLRQIEDLHGAVVTNYKEFLGL